MNSAKCCVALNPENRCPNKRLTASNRAFINAISKCISDEQTLIELFSNDNIYVCSKHIAWRLDEIIRSKQVDNYVDYATFKTCAVCNKYKLEKDYAVDYDICRKCCLKEQENKSKLIFRKMNAIKKCAVHDCNNKSLSSNIYVHTDILSCYKILVPYYDCCLNHQIDGWRKELFQNGKKPCNNYMKGCRNTLHFKDKQKTCDDCKNTVTVPFEATALQCKYCNDVMLKDKFADENCCISCKTYRTADMNNLTYQEYLNLKLLGIGCYVKPLIIEPSIDITQTKVIEEDNTDEIDMFDLIQNVAKNR